MFTKRFSWHLLLTLVTISLLLVACSSAASTSEPTATSVPLATLAPTEIIVMMRKCLLGIKARAEARYHGLSHIVS